MRVAYPPRSPKVGDSVDLRVIADAARAALDGNVVFQGPLTFRVTEITSADSPYKLSGASVLLANPSGGAITVNLPPAANYRGVVYLVKKTDSGGNTVTLDGDGAETIDGAATLVLSAAYEAKRIVSNGTAWFTI